ncbi:MAG: S8 family serine peptidase [Acidobacteria bacterium]|nr:S8 family serine peptidase [Acidobacteriota bacterium]
MRRSAIPTLIACMTALGTLIAVQAAATAMGAQVRPWVVDHTANGASAEFFVVLRAQADLSAVRNLPTKRQRGRFVFHTLLDLATRTQGPLRAWLDQHHVWYRPYYIVNAILVRGNRALVERLAARSDVLRIEGNPHIQNVMPTPILSLDTTRASSVEWGIARTHAPDVWAMGFTGQGIVVGGQDTGVDWTHPALKGHYRGWNGSSADHNYNWHDSIHDSVGNPCGNDSPEPCDDYDHGTHTMGTVVGDDGQGNQIGMAPGAKWIACRNMDDGVGTPARYLECFQFFLAPYPIGGSPSEGDPDKAPDVTNNSWGCPASEGCSWDTLKSAVEAQRDAGIMTVVSAGNDGPSCGTVGDPPALYDAAYSVGATTASDTLASFSSRGPASNNQGNPNLMKPDIVAPGSNVRSALPGGGYGTMSGTSMAGPHVAGAVALIWSAKPDLKNDLAATENLLDNSASRLTSVVESCGGDYANGPNNSWGYGLVDVKQALTEDVTLQPTALAVTETSGNGNGILEPGEVFLLSPTWFNPGSLPAVGVTGSAVMSAGLGTGSSTASYGTIAAGASSSCAASGDCYSALVSSSRPAGHLDRTITETLSSGETQTWVLHIGDSFTDVPEDFWTYAFIETLFHNGVTAGCSQDLYCPRADVTRAQMAVFIAKAMAGGATIPTSGTVPGKGTYNCTAGGTSVFDDVDPGSATCPYVHFIAAHGITAGCGDGTIYCPQGIVNRWQMAVFIAKGMADGAPIPTGGTISGMGSYDCSAGGVSLFGDITPTDPACPHIHYLAAHQVTAGCGNGDYCPSNLMTRDQMAVFLVKGFDLKLYQP